MDKILHQTATWTLAVMLDGSFRIIGADRIYRFFSPVLAVEYYEDLTGEVVTI